MEDENKTGHSFPATCTSLLPNSDSGDDSPPPITGNGGEEAKEKTPEDPEVIRELKRRKLCPTALEKCEAILIKSCSNSNCFSFSFDPKYSSGASTPEVTPKFGSFNLVAAAAVSTEIEEKSVEQKVEEEEEEEEEKDDEVKEKRKIVEVLGSVDGIRNAD